MPVRLTQGKHLRLFVAVMVLSVLFPILDSSLGRVVWEFAVWGVLLVGLSSVRQGAWTRVAWVLAIGAIIASAVDLTLAQTDWLLGLSLSCSIAFLVLLVTMLLGDVMTGTRFDSETLFGAVSIYMLLGLIFALAYMFLNLTSNSLIDHSGAMNLDSRNPIDFLYFSFVTLTTLGFGDVTPQTTAAKGCVTSEALLGQLYLTILVARLVGLTISQNIAQRQEA
jgi:hypothetical protein